MPQIKLSPGENFMRLARGEMPEYVPIHTMGFPGYNGDTAFKIVGPTLFDETHLTPAPQGRTDIWGVKYIANEETNFACIPEPNSFLLEDITKWREVIKAPEVPDGIDWELTAKRDIEASGIDRSRSAAMAVIGLMPFQQLIAFMGFNNGLLAFYEEPECVKELLDFMADTYMPIVNAAAAHYDADMVYLLDDTATNYSPFIGPEMYRDFLKPIYAQLTKPFTERGIPVLFHNCGRCEDFIDDMIDIGTTIWDPAQPTNDLDAIKRKYGRKLAIAGGFNWTPHTDYTEEEVRQAVRDCFDRYAPDGGYAFMGSVLSRHGDETYIDAARWIADESYNYGRSFYLK